MVIKKQPVISYLLGGDYQDIIGKLGIAGTQNPINWNYLNNGFNILAKAQNSAIWGLPELVTSSFEDIMKRNAKSFFNIDHELFQEFCENRDCGILISKSFGTIIYGFEDDKLLMWLFRNNNNKSILYHWFYVESTENNTRNIYCFPTLIYDEQLFCGKIEERSRICEYATNFVMTYLAVKNYLPVETVVVKPNTVTKLDDLILNYKGQDKKIRNDSGQEVIVMDSRWFRKIVNNNDISVRGHFRLQNYKNEYGEWDKKKIFIDPFVKHGYHRNAKIEDDV